MDADLVILEGMGRGVESNLEAEFSCDAVNLAMIKDTAVAARHGGKVFDVVCRYLASISDTPRSQTHSTADPQNILRR